MIANENFRNCLEDISKLEKVAWQELSKASTDEDYTKSTNVTTALRELKNLKNTIELSYKQYRQLEIQLVGKSITREIEIEITKGALEQNYLTLTKAIKAGLAPQDDRVITITTRIGDFQTKVLKDYKRLQDRSFIAKVFADFELIEGDKIIWRELKKDSLYEISPIIFDDSEENSI